MMGGNVVKRPISEGQWVRLRRGPLKGDLAKVLEVMEGGSRAFIMAVPRRIIRIEASRASVHHLYAPYKKSLMSSRQPRLLASRRNVASTRLTDEAIYDFWKQDYYKDGFLFKEVGCDSYLNNEDVKPRLEELQLFKQVKQKGAEDEDDEDDEAGDGAESQSMQKSLMKDLKAQMKTLEEANVLLPDVPFVVGDLVEVVSGEMTGLIAQVKARVQPTRSWRSYLTTLQVLVNTML